MGSAIRVRAGRAVDPATENATTARACTDASTLRGAGWRATGEGRAAPGCAHAGGNEHSERVLGCWTNPWPRQQGHDGSYVVPAATRVARCASCELHASACGQGKRPGQAAEASGRGVRSGARRLGCTTFPIRDSQRAALTNPREVRSVEACSAAQALWRLHRPQGRGHCAGCRQASEGTSASAVRVTGSSLALPGRAPPPWRPLTRVRTPRRDK